MARLAHRHAPQAGVSLNLILRAAGVTRGQIENPRLPNKVESQIKLLNLVAAGRSVSA
jgi:hypothetical protein